MTEQKHNAIAEQPLPNVIGNKYKVVLASAEEAKKLKLLDKDKTVSLGKISIEAMHKVLTKANKKKDKADELAEQEEKKV
ncbi:MAG: hypothetical protein HY920_04990 [Elusimicrobia bacterium]|nr:hypothetical protein [Elusimicrobiota bacterium]